MTYFYQKLIVIDSILEELHGMDLSDEERTHLASLLDSSLHHVILDEILSNLGEADKKMFLKRLHDNPEDEELWDFLNQKIEGVEEKIKKVSEQLVKEMHEDVKKAKAAK